MTKVLIGIGEAFLMAFIAVSICAFAYQVAYYTTIATFQYLRGF